MKKTINKKKVVAVVGIFIFMIAIILFNIKKPKKVKQLSLIINNYDVTSNLKKDIFIANNIVYLDLEDVKANIDDNLYQEDNKIILSGDKKIAAMELDKREFEINGSNIEIEGQPFKKEERRNLFADIRTKKCIRYRFII